MESAKDTHSTNLPCCLIFPSVSWDDACRLSKRMVLSLTRLDSETRVMGVILKVCRIARTRVIYKKSS